MFKIKKLIFLFFTFIFFISQINSYIFVNSENWEDIYLGGIYSEFVNDELKYFSTNIENFDYIKTLDKVDNFTYIKNNQNNFGDFSFENYYNIDLEIVNTTEKINLQLANKSNKNSFFLIKNNHNAISIISYLTKNDIFPIFLNSKNKQEVFDFLILKNKSSQIQIHYISEFENSTINIFEKFPKTIFDDKFKYGNNYYFYNISQYKITLLSNGNFIENDFFKSNTHILFLPNKYLSNNLFNKISSFDLNGSISFLDNFSIIKNFSSIFDIKIFYKRYHISKNNIIDSQKFILFSPPNIINISERNIKINISSFDYDNGNFLISYNNIGNYPIFSNIKLNLFDSSNNFINSYFINNSNNELRENIIKIENIEINEESLNNFSANFTIIYGEDKNYFDKIINSITLNNLKFNQVATPPPDDTGSSGGSGGGGSSTSSGGTIIEEVNKVIYINLKEDNINKKNILVENDIYIFNFYYERENLKIIEIDSDGIKYEISGTTYYLEYDNLNTIELKIGGENENLFIRIEKNNLNSIISSIIKNDDIEENIKNNILNDDFYLDEIKENIKINKDEIIELTLVNSLQFIEKIPLTNSEKIIEKLESNLLKSFEKILAEEYLILETKVSKIFLKEIKNIQKEYTLVSKSIDFKLKDNEEIKLIQIFPNNIYETDVKGNFEVLNENPLILSFKNNQIDKKIIFNYFLKKIYYQIQLVLNQY